MNILTDTGLLAFWNKIKQLVLGNRPYEPTEFSGKGYKVLEKNIQTVDGVKKNILTAVMLNQSNTIYEIRYDFDLDGETIEIQEGCTLKFDGGSLKNGKLVGKDTIIESLYCQIFDIDIALKGTWNIDSLYSEWFGASHKEDIDDSVAIQKAIDVLEDISVDKLTLLPYNYYISSPLKVSSTKLFTFKAEQKGSLRAISPMEAMITCKDGDTGYIKTKFKNLGLCGSKTYGSSERNADNGFYFPNGFIYSEIIGVDIANCKKAINISNSWSARYINNNMIYCGSGIEIKTYVRNSIFMGNKFRLLDDYGLSLSICSASNIIGNDFDNIGAGIILRGGCAGINIKCNDFEAAALNKQKIKSSEGTEIAESYACIFVTGNPTQSGGGIYTGVAYPSKAVSISNNLFLSNNNKATDKENVCSIYACSLEESEICNNISRENKERNFILTSLCNDSLIKNTNISNNTIDASCKKIGYNYDSKQVGWWRKTFQLCYSFDNDVPNGIINLSRRSFPSNRIITGKVYKNLPVFKVPSTTFASIGDIFKDEEIVEYEGLIVEIFTYFSLDEGKSYTPISFVMPIKSGENINFQSDVLYTYPICRFALSAPITENVILSHGKTSERPVLNYMNSNVVFFDDDLGKFILWKVTKWVNIDGSDLSS